MAKWTEGDTEGVPENNCVETEMEFDEEAVRQSQSFHWGNRNAKEWSKMMIKDLFLNNRIYETSKGPCKIVAVERCEGDAYGTRTNGFSANYSWQIRLRWKGNWVGTGDKDKPDLTVTGTIDINNFNANNRNDLSIQVKTDMTRPEAEELTQAFRSNVTPRIRGELDNYEYFLLDILRTPNRPSLAISTKPSAGKPHQWLKSSQHDASHSQPSGGNNDTSSSQPAGYIDVFQEREGAGGMRVGRDFQAKIPPPLSLEDRMSPQENAEKALLVWSPTERITEIELEQYLETSRDRFQYSGEQALGLLFWHRYDIERALQDLGNFTPHPEEWTVEDKVLFEQAFQFHGKAFDRIRAMLPDKSMSNLIRYYYKWKKFKNKPSAMDRQAKKFSQEDGEDASLFVGGGNNNNNRHIQGFRAPHHGMAYSDVESDVIELEDDEYYD